MQAGKEKCTAVWLGRIPYLEAWELQNELAGEIAEGKRGNTLLLLEHPHTYTLGRTGHVSNLLWDETTLAKQGVEVHWVDRGGDITYHGPGQLVAYPIIRLAPPGWQWNPSPQVDFIGYLRHLEQVIITTCSHFGLATVARLGLTGVWVQPVMDTNPQGYTPGDISACPLPSKIASIGVKIDAKGVSHHGFALNVNPDMHYWEGIVPCGLEGIRVVSLAKYLDPIPSRESVIKDILQTFGQVFDFEIEEVPYRKWASPPAWSINAMHADDLQPIRV